MSQVNQVCTNATWHQYVHCTLARLVSSNHILVVHQNMEGRGHGLLDFHTSTKESSTVTFFTSNLITCFIDDFTSKMKSQSIDHLSSRSEHIYWILDLEDEVHSSLGYMDKWPSRMQRQTKNSKVGRSGQQFYVGI